MKNKNNLESRVVRYSKKNRLKRKIKKSLKKLGIKFLKNIVYFVVGMMYAIYLLIRSFNNLVARLFMKLPRIMKVIIIYLLIANVGLDFYGIFQNRTLKGKITFYQEVTMQEPAMELKNNTTFENTTQNEAKKIKEYNCTLEHETACKIKKKAEEYGIDWKIAVSISAWETGNWTSDAYNFKKNVGGMMCSSGLINYDSVDEGVEAFVSNLKKNYFDMGLNTLEKIQPKYCPIGAKNDPKGLNQYWLNGTTKIYNNLEAK